MNRKEQHFLSLNIGSSSLLAKVREDMVLTFEGSIGSFTVKDMASSKDSFYKTIAQVEGDKSTIQINLIAYLNKLVKNGEYDASVELKINSIKLNFVSRVFFEILHYLNEMKLMKLEVKSSKNTPSEEEEEEQEEQELPKLQLKLEIGNPIIIIPKNSFSTEAIVADLGKFLFFIFLDFSNKLFYLDCRPNLHRIE